MSRVQWICSEAEKSVTYNGSVKQSINQSISQSVLREITCCSSYSQRKGPLFLRACCPIASVVESHERCQHYLVENTFAYIQFCVCGFRVMLECCSLQNLSEELKFHLTDKWVKHSYTKMPVCVYFSGTSWGEKRKEKTEEGERETETERENSNSQTLFYKDCSLGSVKNLTT